MITMDHIDPDKYLSTYIGYHFLYDKIVIWNGQFPEWSAPRNCLLIIKNYLDSPGALQINILIEAAQLCDIEAGRAELIQGSWTDQSKTILASRIAYAIADLSFVLISRIPSSYCLAAIHAGNHHIEPEQFSAYFHNKILDHLPFILRYKIRNNQRFGDFAGVFDYLSSEDQKLAAFNLDILK